MLKLIPLLGITSMVALTVGANLMLKLGVSLFGIGGVIYAFVLRALPLHVAQAFAAFQYVAVVLAASLLLSERIAPTSWLGIGFIVVGIVLVSTAMRS